jgi:hypothetical protein
MNSFFEAMQVQMLTLVSAAITAFIALSVVLFIIDGVKAKRQHRKRKAGITVMFVIAMIIAALEIIGLAVVIYCLSAYIMSF